MHFHLSTQHCIDTFAVCCDIHVHVFQESSCDVIQMKLADGTHRVIFDFRHKIKRAMRVTPHSDDCRLMMRFRDAVIASLLVAMAAVDCEDQTLHRPPAQETYESTWFSNDRMTGKGEVLKAHSAMASITSWRETNRLYVNRSSLCMIHIIHTLSVLTDQSFSVSFIREKNCSILYYLP